MNEKKYLIYLDILGFEGLAKEMAEGTIFEEDKIRQDYLSDPLKEKIEGIEREGIQIPKGISEIEGSDNYVLIVDNIQTAFELVGKLTTIKIPHKDYESIPLEVALGTKKIDEDIEVKPINRKEIIKFLKEDVINSYRSYYKNKNDGAIKETFVLFTHEFFDDLEPLDTTYCERISYNNKTFFVADLEKIRQRARVFEFLEKIVGSKWIYGRIDEVYVPPSEYEDIAKRLKEKQILFITGTPEYGKTYTAVRLMWEFYNNDYEPRWIKGGSPAKRDDVGEKLEDIRAELKPGHIVYFEDPFGETGYRGRTRLESDIGTIIDSVRQVTDAYVIITSRDEVFKTFKKEKVSARDIGELVVKLNLKERSYDYKKRKEILLSWAEEEKCKWLGNKKLKELVLESIKDEKTLPTPLRIKGFAVSTCDIETEDELKEKIEENSKGTAKGFAKEIKNMDDDKILFLSFLFISNDFEVEFFRATYQELVKELNLKDAGGFDEVLDWCKVDKIDSSGNRIKFSHPSYSEALPYLLVEDGYTTRINENIFSKLLIKLSEKEDITISNVVSVAWTVANNFDMIPEDVRNKLLFKVSEKKGPHEAIADFAAWTVANNFDKLPEYVRSKLLLILSEKKGMSAGNVAWTVANNFDKIHEDVRIKLLLRLSEKNDATSEYVAGVIDENLAWTVANNFDKLPEGVRNKLLVKLSEKDKAAQYVAWAVANNFDKLPEDIRNKLLVKLSEKDNAAGSVAWAVANNFDKLPEDMRNLLDMLQKPLQQVIEDVSRNGEQKDQEEALCLISNVLSKLNLNFVLKTLNDLSKSRNEKVRTKAAKLLKTISYDSDGMDNAENVYASR